MKQALERLVKKGDTQGKYGIQSALMMILLFLTFWGISFYLLVNSLA